MSGRSGRSYETVEHLLLAGLVEVDCELVAFDGGDVAVTELHVEDTVADIERGGRIGDGLCHQLALDGARLDRGATGSVAAVGLAIADALDLVAGARAPVAVGRLGAVCLCALP